MRAAAYPCAFADGLRLHGCSITLHISMSALQGSSISSGACDVFGIFEWYCNTNSIDCGVLDDCEGSGNSSCWIWYCSRLFCAISWSSIAELIGVLCVNSIAELAAVSRAVLAC